MALDLRPLTIAELLDRSFSTYRRHVWVFAGIMSVPAAFALVYAVSMQLFQFSLGRIQPNMTPDQVLARLGPLLLAGLGFMLVYMFIYAFALGATTVAVARLYTEQPVTVGGTYRAVRSQGLWLALLMIWMTVRVMLAGAGVMVLAGIVAAALAFVSRILAVLAIVPGMFAAFAAAVYVSIRYGVAVPAAVLENLGPNRALRRSVDLTEGYRGRIFLILLCALVITYATMALVQMPFVVGATVAGPETMTGLVLNVIGAVFGTAGSTFTGPIMIIGLALAYYDLRIRKEAFDLQLMLESIDAPRT
jgi:hypothetical protein